MSRSTSVALAIARPQCTQVGGAAWTKNWLTFDNSYFAKWKESKDDDDLIWFPTDDALFTDPSFKQFAELYKTNEKAFFKDYASAHKKLSELGVKWVPEGSFTI